MDHYSLSQRVVQCAREAALKSQSVDMTELWDRFVNIDVSQVMAKIEKARLMGWYGAVPSMEPIHLIKETVAAPTTTVGIDGSQIYPEPDSPVHWAFTQAVRFRSGIKPIMKSQFVRQSDLTDENLSPSVWLTMGTVDNLRTLLELEMAYLAAKESPEGVILFDNPLVPYENYGPTQNKWFRDYLMHLKRLQGQVIVGYVSNPKSRLLINLIEIDQSHGKPNSLRYLDDWALIRRILNPGQRTAMFLHGSRRNRTMEDAETGISFFYLKINAQEIVRIEVPQWIAEDQFKVDVVHASILRDCLLLGYPYVLAMAHKQVAIPLAYGNELNQLALRIYRENGGHVRSSAKRRAKGY